MTWEEQVGDLETLGRFSRRWCESCARTGEGVTLEHFSCFVANVLNKRFPDAWIVRGGPIPWQPRSPDLSPLDFFLWGYIKKTLYAEKIRNIQHLQEMITSAIETVTRDMIQKTWQEIEFCLGVSRATNGAHIEMY